jgi:DNA gyrase subunit A
MYWLNVYEIPEGSRTGNGKAIVNMIKVMPGEKICAMLTVKKEEFEDPNKFIVMASRLGYIKKTSLSLFKNLRRTGLRALVIEEDDDLIGAAISSNGDEVILSTRKGMACRFDQTDDQIRPMGRTARGVTGMRFKLDDDDIVSMEIIHEHVEDIEIDENEDVADNDEAPVTGSGPQVLVITDGGMGKRSFVSTYRKTNRGARGVVNIRLREGEKVLSVVQITEDDELLLTTERGQMTRIPVSEIRRVGRASLGVRIMNLKQNDKITGVAKLIKVAEEDSSSAAENATPIETENIQVGENNVTGIPEIEIPAETENNSEE